MPTPVALGITLCDTLLIEEGTRKVALIGCFSALTARQFPTGPRTFFAYADLTDSEGSFTAELIVSRLDTQEEIYRTQRSVHFADRLRVVRCGVKVADCRFPAPGEYLVTLFIGGDWVAQRPISLYTAGASG